MDLEHELDNLKLLIAYDQVFSVTPAGAVFTEGEFSGEMLERYRDVFDEVVVVGRKEALSHEDARRLSGTFSRCDGDGISFEFLPGLSMISAFFGPRQKARRRLDALLDSCDITLARLPSEIGLLAAEIAAGKSGREKGRISAPPRPWALELVGCPADAFRHHGRKVAAFYGPVQAFRVRRAVARAPFVHYVTANFLQDRYPSKGRQAAFSDVLLPAPAVDVLERRLARIERAGLEESAEPFVMGIIATLKVRYKGIEFALRAMKEARDYLGDFRFRILGPGDPAPWRRMAREFGLEERVYFDGVLPRGSSVLKWLDGLDIYLQPSLTEALPRGLIEAMSRGLPALGSRAGEIPELLDASCLHEPGDWRTLSKHLIQARRKDWRQEMGRRNFRRARDFSPALLEPLRHRWLNELARAARNGI